MQHRVVHSQMPADPQAFLKEWKDQMLDGMSFLYMSIPLIKSLFLAIVEQVRDGSTLRIRLILSDELHQIVSIMLAGVKSPKFGRDNEPNEQYAEEASNLPLLPFIGITYPPARLDYLRKAVSYNDSSVSNYYHSPHHMLSHSRPQRLQHHLLGEISLVL
jgi:hypothetical protein